METHEIRYFLAVVKELNFTRAAASCGVTQPALTRAIQKLETELGGALFLRRPGRIELTQLARTILPELEAIAGQLGHVRDIASLHADQRQHQLRLGVMCTVGPTHILSLLNQLRATLPTLELSIIDARANAIVDMIASDSIDVGISAWPSYPDHVHAEVVLQERYAVAMRDTDPWAAGGNVTLANLDGASYIERLGCEFDAFFEVRHGKWPITLDVRFMSEREDWTSGLVQAGHGYSIVPEFMDLPPGLVKIPLAQPEVQREISILTLRGKPLGPAAANFSRLAKAHCWRRPLTP